MINDEPEYLYMCNCSLEVSIFAEVTKMWFNFFPTKAILVTFKAGILNMTSIFFVFKFILETCPPAQ